MPETVEVGCYVDGHWGHYGIARMVQVAEELGYGDPIAIDLASRHMNTDYGLNDRDWDTLVDCADKAEQWLNENVAAEGYAFGWNDGEFFYSSIEWWEDA